MEGERPREPPLLRIENSAFRHGGSALRKLSAIRVRPRKEIVDIGSVVLCKAAIRGMDPCYSQAEANSRNTAE